ncbi:asparaginase domain-containing protein [Polynucleobacter necessarius]|uniref:asparaginase domain-containing protein n=1 Tax=Polynucleobacter necessarius TaxID=576610 RepID=UPI0018D55D9F|nr:asparaginase domain-containing protein [Polynucleobacter necessarius]
MTIQSASEITSHILVLGVGGTIAGVARDPSKPFTYTAGQLEIGAILEKLGAGLPSSVKLVSRQMANIDSGDLSEELLTQIANTVIDELPNPLLKGIVITHSTDTVEETGFFLDSTCGKLAEKLGKRVVLTGAMLPSNAARADGPQNLADAIQWADTAPENCPGGVFAVFAGKVCMARDLAKRHTNTFNAPLMDSPYSTTGLINPSWLSRVKAVQSALSEDLPVPQGVGLGWRLLLAILAHGRSLSMRCSERVLRGWCWPAQEWAAFISHGWGLSNKRRFMVLA